MADSNTTKSKRGAAAADAEKQSAEKTQAELEKLDELDLDKIAGGATKKSPNLGNPVNITQNPATPAAKKGVTSTNATIIKR